MSHNDELQKLRTEVDNHDSILRGQPGTGKGGLVNAVENTSQAVFGKPGSPGLIEQVGAIKKLIWMGAGGVLTIKLVWELVNFVIRLK